MEDTNNNPNRETTMKDLTNVLRVTLSRDSNPSDFARFDHEAGACDFVTFGNVSDAELDAMITTLAYEGGPDLAGWTMTIA